MNDISTPPSILSTHSDSACSNAPTIADCNRGFLRLQLKKFDEAWDDFQTAGQKNRGFYEARFDEAFLHAQSKRPLRAARSYFAAFAASPSSQAAFSGLVQSLRRASPYNEQYIGSHPMLQTATRLGRPVANWLIDLELSMEPASNPSYMYHAYEASETTMVPTSTPPSPRATRQASCLAAGVDVGGSPAQGAADAFEESMAPAPRTAASTRHPAAAAPDRAPAPAPAQLPAPARAPAPSEPVAQRRPHRRALLTTAVVGTALLAPLCGCGLEALGYTAFCGALAGLAVGLEKLAAKHCEMLRGRPLATTLSRVTSTLVSGDTEGDAAFQRIYHVWQRAEEMTAGFVHAMQAKAASWLRAAVPKLRSLRTLCVASAQAGQIWLGRTWASVKQRWHAAAAKTR